MIIEPSVQPRTSVTYVAFGGLDGYRSVALIEGALADDVLIAKHLCRIELHTAEPTDADASLADRLLAEHPRARVWEEERHRYLPAWSVRPIYRLLIPPIAFLSARGSRRSPTPPASR